MVQVKNWIDFSQYKSWWKCPWYWHEKYINQVEKRRPEEGYKSDALTIGSLTHNGLENWGKSRKPVIDNEAIKELMPSPEALVLAKQLVQEYITRYPNEEFKYERTEEPLLFGLEGVETTGLALIDNHFYNEKLTVVESGITGEQITLQPGWWIREYKTKDASRPRGAFAQTWANNMQADFQLLALAEKIGEAVQGIFVCVLEKPKMYVPVRKCKGCGERLELGTYLSTGEGGHACPLCGHIQKLTPYIPKVEKRAEVYRLAVTRSKEKLEESRTQIAQVAEQMEKMRSNPSSIAPNKEACVIFKTECEYFNNHTYGVSTLEDEGMVKRNTTRYARLEELVNING